MAAVAARGGSSSSTMSAVNDDVFRTLREKAVHAKGADALPSPSMSSKVVKDLLMQDPSNLNLIYKLGICYARDGLWNQSSNVLHRGWSRVQELEDPVQRLMFGMTFCEACYRNNKPTEALNLLRPTEEHLEKAQHLLNENYLQTVFFTLACNVHSATSNRQLALKFFYRAIDCQPFDKIMSVWAGTRAELAKCGAYDNAKKAVENMASGEEDLQKLQIMEEYVSFSGEDVNELADADVKKSQRLHQRLCARIRAFLATSPLERFSRWTKRLSGRIYNVASAMMHGRWIGSVIARIAPRCGRVAR